MATNFRVEKLNRVLDLLETIAGDMDFESNSAKQKALQYEENSFMQMFTMGSSHYYEGHSKGMEMAIKLIKREFDL